MSPIQRLCQGTFLACSFFGRKSFAVNIWKFWCPMWVSRGCDCHSTDFFDNQQCQFPNKTIKSSMKSIGRYLSSFCQMFRGNQLWLVQGSTFKPDKTVCFGLQQFLSLLLHSKNHNDFVSQISSCACQPYSRVFYRKYHRPRRASKTIIPLWTLRVAKCRAGFARARLRFVDQCPKLGSLERQSVACTPVVPWFPCVTREVSWP